MLILLGVVFALLLSFPAHAQVTTKSYIKCLTRVGPKSTSPVRTTSAVLTVPWYAYRYVTSVPSTTITPGAVTTTSTVTATSTETSTPPPNIQTFTSTTTSTNTITQFETETDTETATATTTTTVTAATTIPAPAGFQPIESYISGSMKRKGRSVDGVAPAAEAIEARQASTPRVVKQGGKRVYSPMQYPQAVTCAGFVAVITTKVSTKTAKTSSTITAATPTSTATLTTSTTVTTTLPPASASTTLTETAFATATQFSTVTTTTTTTTTSTETVSQPASTTYAACAENNLITQRNGQGMSYWEFWTESFAPSAYECCVSCQTTAGCAGAVYDYGYCYLYVNSGTCNQNAQGQRIGFGGSGPDPNTVAIGGPCGRTQPDQT